MRLFAASLLAFAIFASPAAASSWAPADKHGFGTARQLGSPVWFTLRQASLSEVYYPDLDTPSFRGLQFAVSDGKNLDREVVDDDPAHIEPSAVRARVEPVPGSLTFKQITETSRWRLTKTWYTDPGRASVLADVKFESKTHRPLRLYVLADPAASDTLNDDRGRGMVAWDASSASAVEADPGLRQESAGYRGTPSDPWIDLQDQRLSGSVADTPGDVVEGALTQLDGVRHRSMKLAIGFGRDAGAAVGTARASLHAKNAARDYASAWTSYLASLKRPPASAGRNIRLYQQSLMVLAASEDKLNPGASVAAPNMPWVWGTLTLENPADGHSGPYHLVWPRDFFHVVTAQSAAGDSAAAARELDYLWKVQKPDGSWWQNTEPDGDPHWTGLQMDEVALPIVLAWELNRPDWAHIQKAADFIVANGPKTGQERWENQDGYSPNTIATEIAGLVCAADIARRNGANAKADTYLATADDWQRRVEAMTATNNGPLSDKPYYLRITKDANPNDGSTYDLGDNYSPNPIDERRVVDNSFLGLVLFGAKKWNDPTILNSLAVGDRELRVNTPNGPVWHRFSHDGYGETDDGGDWNIFPTAANQTHGRLWPLLTGERGEYELLAGRRADAYLETMAKSANDGLMLPEQVFENSGEGTRSATPLAWTHAQFIRLAWSIQAGTPIERPSIVAERYAR
jgi:glucoamylase